MEQERQTAEERPWSLSASEAAETLGVDPALGLTQAEAARRLGARGRNEIVSAKRRSRLSILIKQFRSVLVLLLVVAAALSAAFGHWAEALAVLMVPILNAFIGFFTELRATRSVEALRQLGTTMVTARRDGALVRLPSSEVVPGDVLLVEGGDVVAADSRVLHASRLQADESALTGESLPVQKGAEPTPAEAPLHDRRCVLFKGTAVTRGSAETLVFATGMDTELGRISALTESAESESTPLEKRLDALGKSLIWVTAIVAVLITATGIGSGKSVVVLLQTAIALAVATVPEGLPIIATLTLARGVKRMADRNALVSRLSAVEALGATSVILTDKTGTLTENRMRVAEAWSPSGENGQDEAHRRLLRVAVLCNNAELPSAASEAAAAPAAGRTNAAVDGATNGVGDPMEVALLEYARSFGVERDDLARTMPKSGEEAFDPEVKMMATFHRLPAAVLVAVKGGPGPVLQHSSHHLDEEGRRVPLTDSARQSYLEHNRRMAERDLRVLALAERESPASDDPYEDPYDDLTFLGFIGFLDPPREDVAPAIAACRAAGIRVVMVTGDQPTTARSIAKRVGLVDGEPGVLTGVEVERLLAGADGGDAPTELLAADVLARVSPEQKLRLIEAHQRNGEIVAMTGDGVNDAPALKRADIGIAMGLRGTEVAREAADMVLKDDAFSTIKAAVKEGRVIFDNIRAFVVFLMSCNLSEIAVIGIAGALGFPLPLLPLQILFINLVTDVFPALALGTLKGDDSVLRRRARPAGEAILSVRQWRSVTGYAALIAASVLAAFLLALYAFEMSQAEAVTISFLALAVAQILHVFNMREPGSGVWRNTLTTDPWVWAAVFGCLGLIAIVVTVPPLASLLSIAPLDAAGWWLVAGGSAAPLLLGAIGKALGLGRIG